MALKRLNIETLYNTFLGLQPRERLIALGGAVAAVLFAVGLPISIASSQLGSLEEEISELKKMEQQIYEDLKNYQQIDAELTSLEQKIATGFDGSMLSTFSSLAEELTMRQQLVSSKDRGETPFDAYDEVKMELTLKNVTLPQIMQFLHRVEHHAEHLYHVQSFNLKRDYRNPQLFDVNKFVIATYRLQKPEGEVK